MRVVKGISSYALLINAALLLLPSVVLTQENFTLRLIKADQQSIEVAIDTTLPDNAEVRFSLSRSYQATSEGKSDTYSQDYFREDGTVAQWREPRGIRVDDDAWAQELRAHQDRMAKIGLDFAIKVDSIDQHLEATAYAYAHKSGERYGAREYNSLIDKVRETELVGKSEVRVMRPMVIDDVQNRSLIVAGSALEVQHSYRLIGDRTPLMPSLFGGTLEDIAGMVDLPAGTVIVVLEVAYRNGDPWYHVSLPDHGGRKGWINSIALVWDGAQRLEMERQRTVVLPTETEAEGYLPPCASSSKPLPDWLRCPTPYVELVPEQRDDIFERNWYCREKEYSFGLVRGGGCGSSSLAGWSIPIPQPTATVDYSAEIIAHVVDPCYLDMVKRNRVEGVSDQQMLELLKVIQAGNINNMVTSVTTLITNTQTPEQRALIYELGKQTCINAARNAQ